MGRTFLPETEGLCGRAPLEGILTSQGQEFLGRGFPGGAVVENLPANAGEIGRAHV